MFTLGVKIRSTQQSTDTWESSVEGLQMKLVSAANTRGGFQLSDQLELQLRNRGSRTATIVPDFIGHLPQIEADRVWYSPAGAPDSSPRVETLPGNEANYFSNTRLIFSQMLKAIEQR